MDIEKNGIMWIPPEPEDKEDEKETSVFDDDDYDGGCWALPHSTGSFTASECKREDRVSEKYRKAMREVLDGHFRALVEQRLKAESVPVGEKNKKESWLEIVTSLSWQAASLVKPDTSKGGGGMVKVKCLACGHSFESEVIRGVVCKKNITNRRMAKSCKNPRLLILGGALEYQRVSNVLSSLDTLIPQEKEDLKMIVAKIEAHHPNVLLVEKTVSHLAHDYLLAKEISLVLNIKRPLLEHIARFTGAQIVPSVDNLTAAKVGHCESFHVDNFLAEHDSAGQTRRNSPKTLMFFEGSPNPLGCTVLLKGSNSDELKKVKNVVQFAVSVAYRLDVETSFLADEVATLPELFVKSPITVGIPDKISVLDRSISKILGFMIPTSVQINTADMQFPAKGALTENTVVQQKDMHAIPESFSCLPPPEHLISELSSSIKKTCFKSPDQRSNSSVRDNSLPTWTPGSVGHQFPREEKSHELQLENQENMENQPKATLFMDHKITGHDNRNNVHSEGQWPSKEDFTPPPHQQSILVSLSTRHVWKGTICECAPLPCIQSYGSFDKPFGRFLKDDLFNQTYYRCNSCDAPAEAHVHCYTHQQGSLTIAVKSLDETVLPGEREGKIWMWHLCVKGTGKTRKPLPTRRLVMSDAACALSFGRFLELSFSNHAAAIEDANCGHSLHRDCLRFYGFGRMVACLRYAPIHVHSVHLPPPKLEFNYPNQQEWLRKEVSDVEAKAKLLFAEVSDSLRQIAVKIASSGPIYAGTKIPESRRKIEEFERILQKEETYLEEIIQKTVAKDHEPGQPIADILELNHVRFRLYCQSREWKNRLQFLASSLKRPPGSSTSSIAEELNLLVQKEKNKDDRVDNSSLCEKILRSNEIETYDGDACPDTGPNFRNEHDPLQAEKNVSLTAAKVESMDHTANVQARSEQERLQVSAPTSPVKSNIPEEFVSWIGASFSDLYKAYSKSFQGSLSGFPRRFDSVLNYIPSYVSSVSQLGDHGGTRLSLVPGVDDIIIVIYDDEPTSIIAYAITSYEYHAHISDKNKQKEKEKEIGDSFGIGAAHFNSHQASKVIHREKSYGSDDSYTSGSKRTVVSDPFLFDKAIHVKVFFDDERLGWKVKYMVTCYYAVQFDALRKKCCPTKLDFIRSLCRCRKWGAKGGKSNVFFAKTLDDRFIVKQVTKTELESFMKFAPKYFKHLSESLSTGSPTCLAKILGIYQVTTKHGKGGRELKMDLMLMENLLYGRNVTHLYDLKGSPHSCYNRDSTGSNNVLLDQNLLESIETSPIFVGIKAKRLLERAVWNDTAFLALIDVMDYSLLVGVDEERRELVLGIIDFMRQYTWDKHLETWVKASGILGGPKNTSPTVISPKQYKKRFRKAMSTYFLMVPDQWTPPTVDSGISHSEICEDVAPTLVQGDRL